MTLPLIFLQSTHGPSACARDWKSGQNSRMYLTRKNCQGRDWVSVRAMVRRFCAELSEALHLDMPVPHGFKEASSQFIELLVKATKTYGIDVLCIVDGYDQVPKHIRVSHGMRQHRK
jgi:hypothetical protein